MSLPKLSTVVVVVLLLASLTMVVVSSVHPSDPANTSDGAPERIGHLHLESGGSDKITLAVQGDSLHVPRFATQEGTWHASGLTPPARMSYDDDDDADFASLLGDHKHLKLKDLRAGEDPTLDALAELARSTATTLDDDRLKIMSMFTDERQEEPADVWKIMSCALLISEQNGGAWDSKEAVQLRSMGFFSKEDVAKQLRVIAWPNDCSEPITLDRDSL